MAISKIRVINWAIYTDEYLELNDNDSLISGANASGKTVLFTAIGYFFGGDTYFKKIKDSSKEDNKKNVLYYVFGKTTEKSQPLRELGTFYSYIQIEFLDVQGQSRTFTICIEPKSNTSVSVYRFSMNCKMEDFVLIDNELKLRNHSEISKQYLLNSSFVDYDTMKGFKNEIQKVLGIRNMDLLVQQLAFNTNGNRQMFSDPQNIFNMIIMDDDNTDSKMFFGAFEELKDEEEKLTDKIDERNKLIEVLNKFSVLEEYNEKKKAYELSISGLEKRINQLLLDKNEELLKENNIKQININEGIDQIDLEKCNLTIVQDELELKNKESSAEINISEERLKEQKKLKTNLEKQFTSREQWHQYWKDLKLGNKDFYLNDFVSSLNNINNDSTSFNKEFIKYKKNLDTNKINSHELNGKLKSDKDILLNQIKEVNQELKELEKKTWQPHRMINDIQKEYKNKLEDKFKILYGESIEINYLFQSILISDKKWKNTIEAFLGNKRFYLIIPKEYRDIAMEVFKTFPREKRCTIALVYYSDAENISVKENSLNQFVQIINPSAEQFVTASLNNTRCVSADEFSSNFKSLHNGWITSDGDAYIGFSLRNYHTNNEAIGEDALIKRTEALKEEAEVLKGKYEKLKKEFEINNENENYYTQALNELSKWSNEWYTLDERIESNNQNITVLQKSIDDLKDLNYIGRCQKISELNEQIISLKNKIDNKEKELKPLNSERITLSGEIEGLTNKINLNTFDINNIDNSFFISVWSNSSLLNLNELKKRKNDFEKQWNDNNSNNELRELLTISLLEYNKKYNHSFTTYDKHIITSIYDSLNGKLEKIKITISRQKNRIQHLVFNDFIKNLSRNYKNGYKAIRNYNRDLSEWEVSSEKLELDLIAKNFDDNTLEHNILFLKEKYDENGEISNMFLSEYEEQIRIVVEGLIEKRKISSLENVVNDYVDLKHYNLLDIIVKKSNNTVERFSESKDYASNGEFKRRIFVLQLLALNCNIDGRYNNSKTVALVDEFSNDFDATTVDDIMELCDKQKKIQFIICQQSKSSNPYIPTNQFAVRKFFDENSKPYSIIIKREVENECF